VSLYKKHSIAILLTLGGKIVNPNIKLVIFQQLFWWKRLLYPEKSVGSTRIIVQISPV
jgi:hypothetical protein